MKAKLLACCMLIILSGCYANKIAEEVANGVVDEMQKASEIYMIVLIYHGHNNKWPDSIEELKAFYSKSKEECPDLDWSKYKHVSFHELPDGKLKIESKSSQDQRISSFSGVLDVPELGIEETSDCP